MQELASETNWELIGLTVGLVLLFIWALSFLRSTPVDQFEEGFGMRGGIDAPPRPRRASKPTSRKKGQAEEDPEIIPDEVVAQWDDELSSLLGDEEAGAMPSQEISHNTQEDDESKLELDLLPKKSAVRRQALESPSETEPEPELMIEFDSGTLPDSVGQRSPASQPETVQPNRPKRTGDPIKHGLIEPILDYDESRTEALKPNRKRSDLVAEQEAPSPAPTEVPQPGYQPPVAPVSPETYPHPYQQPVQPEQPQPARVPPEQPSEPLTPAAFAPGSAPQPGLVQPIGQSAPVVQPAATYPGMVQGAGRPAPVSGAASRRPIRATKQPFWKRLFGGKDPRNRIGKRVLIKRGKLEGRYGTIVSVDGDNVVVSDRSGRKASIRASDL
ncbi:MAG: KOW motif-containing protein [Verrucomicrobiota bacterium]